MNKLTTMKDRPFLLIGLLGIVALAAGFWVSMPMKAASFEMPEGFTNPTLAMEFGRDPIALADMFEPLDETKVDAVKTMLWHDNIFLVLYTFLILGFTYQVYRQTGNRRYLWLLPVVVLIGMLDAVENFQTARVLNEFIVRHLSPMQGDVYRIVIASWGKWLLLLGTFFTLRYYLRSTNLIGKAMNMLVWPVALLAIVGLAGVNQAAEWYAMSVTLVLLPLLLVFCFTFKNRP